MGLLSSFFKNSVDVAIKENENSSVKNDFSNFTLITQYIYERSGITDLDKRGLISNHLKEFAQEQNIFTTDDFLNTMKNNKEFYQNIMNIVTVNETYFFREIKELEWLVAYIKKSNTSMKILSIPCSSGEEVYSILLMLSEANVDINKIKIFGYDINSDAVERAREGLYSERSLHKLESHIKEKYFTKLSDNLYSISALLKSRAIFEQKNIFELTNEESIFDIVLSRNMFIYFDNEKRTEATDIIVHLLRDSGIYVKGHADHIKPHTNLQNINFGIYQKV